VWVRECYIPFLTVVGWLFFLDGTIYLDVDFWGGFSMTGCFIRTSIEPGGRRLDTCQTEDGRRFDGREGGRMLHSKVGRCWVEVLGRDYRDGDFGDGVFYDGSLCTGLD